MLPCLYCTCEMSKTASRSCLQKHIQKSWEQSGLTTCKVSPSSTHVCRSCDSTMIRGELPEQPSQLRNAGCKRLSETFVRSRERLTFRRAAPQVKKLPMEASRVSRQNPLWQTILVQISRRRRHGSGLQTTKQTSLHCYQRVKLWRRGGPCSVTRKAYKVTENFTKEVHAGVVPSKTLLAFGIFTWEETMLACSPQVIKLFVRRDRNPLDEQPAAAGQRVLGCWVDVAL